LGNRTSLARPAPGMRLPPFPGESVGSRTSSVQSSIARPARRLPARHSPARMTSLATRPSCLLAIGGRAKPNATRLPEWQGYQCGLILAVQPTGPRAWTCATYQSPPHLCPASDPSFVFKAATIRNHNLYACTQTELLIYRVSDFRLLRHISHPWFNDLHHVYPFDDDRLLVAVTGLDMVVEIDLVGRIIRSWDVLGNPPFSRFPRDLDFRCIPTTKPHLSHPNHIFTLGEEIWVTRFLQRDAICLNVPGKRIDIGPGHPHDGIVVDQFIYFTTVEGHIVVVDESRLEKSQILDLNVISDFEQPLGWCRGIKVLADDEIIVGFSRLRPTKWQIGTAFFRSSIRMSTRQLPKPTRLVCYNIRHMRVEWEVVLEDYQMNAIFSIV
jgi:hypothetical protein